MSRGLEVMTLGGLSIRFQDEPLKGLHSRKVEALIVYVMSMRQPQARHVLADLLWEEDAQAAANLRVLLTNLRHVLPDVFAITRTEIAVNPRMPHALDTTLFEDYLDAAQKLNRSGASSHQVAAELERALTLYRGDFLKGFYIRESPRFEEWALLEQERLRQRGLNALQQLANLYLEQREYARGILAARRLFEIDPLNELTQQQLMQLLARNGESHAALMQYEKYKQLLALELNAEPAPETIELRDKIRAGAFTAKTSPGSRRDLPRMLTPFVGRANELAELEMKLQDPDVALVTLLGPGGVGKTRLAVRVAEQLHPQLRDGVVFVALAPVADPNHVVATIAGALELGERVGEPLERRVQEYLRDKEMLLVLDNFEQVLEAAGFIGELLIRCAKLKILATSREHLHLYGEHEFPVIPLAFPSAEQLAWHVSDAKHTVLERIARYPAVALFCQRASTAQPEFRLTEGNARAIVEICARLDGLPLALELAAARLNQFTPQQLLERLSKLLNVLADGERNRPERHRTMRGALEWSYALLQEREKRTFCRLGMLRGNWDLTLAGLAEDDSLLPTTLDVLHSLVSKSLVLQLAREAPSPRYTMLETVREYALEKLAERGELQEMERKHALFFWRLAREAEPQLAGPSQVQWLNHLDDELDNIRAALDWAVRNGEADIGIETAHGLGRFWTVRDHWAEGRRWLERLIELPEAQEPSLFRIQALFSAALLANWMGDFETAKQTAQEAVNLSQVLGEQLWYARSLIVLGSMFQMQGQLSLANEVSLRGIALFEQVGDVKDLAWAHIERCSMELQQGRFEAAHASGEFGLRVLREEGDHWGIGLACAALGLTARIMGDTQAASRYKAEALSLLGQVNDPARIAMVHFFLGSPSDEPKDRDAEMAFFESKLQADTQAANRLGMAEAMLGLASARHRRGDYVEAEAMYRSSLELSHALMREITAAECLAGLAGVAAYLHEPERAARLFGAADALGRLLSGPLAHVWQDYGGDLAMAKSQLDAETFEGLWAEGVAFSMEEAVEYALGQGGNGWQAFAPLLR